MYSGMNTRVSEETISLVQPMRFDFHEVFAGRSISTPAGTYQSAARRTQPLAGSKARLTNYLMTDLGATYEQHILDLTQQQEIMDEVWRGCGAPG